MRYEPHEYQRYATEYIETHPIAAVLLDMGLGKTSITLTALSSLLFDRFLIRKVIVIAPLSEDAPLPPGLSAWPGPGEAAVSPALGTDLTGDLAGRYGHVTSRISLEGLETPQERRVYMRPGCVP